MSATHQLHVYQKTLATETERRREGSDTAPRSSSTISLNGPPTPITLWQYPTSHGKQGRAGQTSSHVRGAQTHNMQSSEFSLLQETTIYLSTDKYQGLMCAVRVSSSGIHKHLIFLISYSIGSSIHKHPVSLGSYSIHSSIHKHLVSLVSIISTPVFTNI
ncbi:hypothetical protein RRG08_045347 [Elysia crispata]|uniref:Uncharacterized protein n=1 Tax=Elysia crispata TaxID=231223 RepID=A0AAE1A298_9GAST|nr:hypothetical protein RRG08_045347 [Elysia crispata]